MIVYQETIKTFQSECFPYASVIANKVRDKMKEMGLGGGAKPQYDAWENSLPYMAKVLTKSGLDTNIDVAIEYKLETSEDRADFIVYGLDENDKPNLLVVELKQWSTVKQSSIPNFVLAQVSRGNVTDVWHPSIQAYNYANILQKFNEYVNDHHVATETCSYLHNMPNVFEAIIRDPKLFPITATESQVFLKDDVDKLADFIKKNVKKPKKDLLYLIDNSTIRPTEAFSRMLHEALKGSPFSSYDLHQAKAVGQALKSVNEAVHYGYRRTIIVKGGPGTGKSVVAMNILGQLIHPADGSKPMNACYVTPNYIPRETFSEDLIGTDYRKSAIANLFKTISSFVGQTEQAFACVIVDEAHRAFQWKFGYGVSKDIDMIDKLFYASSVQVFFIDEDQVVTKDDYLTIDLIKKYAEKYHSQLLMGDDLTLTSQFRCLGGERYVAFINSFLGYDNKHSKYFQPKVPKYDFKICDSASELRDLIFEKNITFKKARIVAGEAYEWTSKLDPNGTDPDDFDIVLDGGAFKMRWNKKQSRSYVNDPLQIDRVGSVSTVQGIDLDYCGVIIGKDMVYRNSQIVYVPEANKADYMPRSDKDKAIRCVRNGYKVLLTRGIRGTYIYCQDEALRNHLKSLIIKEQ